MCVGFACMCVSAQHTCAWGDQKKASDPQELESQVVVSHCVATGDQTQIVSKSGRCS